MVKKANAPAAAPAAPVADAPQLRPLEQTAPEQRLAEPEAPAAPAAESAEPAPAAAPSAPVMVKARVLAACAYGQPDDVIELDAELAKTLEGVVDTAPAAVEYAESLK